MSGVHNLYWKDMHYEKVGGFCKHKSSSLYNQYVEVIYNLPRSGCDTWRRCLITTQIVQASEKESKRNDLLMVAHTIQYLARPG